jgi:hypothetical protein
MKRQEPVFVPLMSRAIELHLPISQHCPLRQATLDVVQHNLRNCHLEAADEPADIVRSVRPLDLFERKL